MNKELIMKSDVLDIIFEKRNKSYGAYNLRKFYNNRLMKSIGLMFGVVIILSAFTFLPKKKKIMADGYVTSPVFIPQPQEKPKEIEKPKATQKPTAPPVTTPSTPIIVKDNVPVTTIKTIVDSGTVLIKTTPGTTDLRSGTTGTGGPAIVTDPPEPAKVVIDKTTPVYFAEKMPEFPGGMDALYKFLQRNLNNPKDLDDGNSVSVKIQFVVGYDGKLQRFQIVEDGGDAFNNEVMRVLKKMPAWIPGKSNGESVSVYYTIPVKFVPSE